MDREAEELQFLGLYGIYREACKILVSWKYLLSQINLALILPLSFILLAQIEIPDAPFANIRHSKPILDRSRPHSAMYNRISSHITSEWIYFFLFKGSYLLFLLVLSLLSTSAIVYTVACIYTCKQIAFKKVMSVVPKVWKRLMVTFLWNFIIILAFNLVAFYLVVLSVLLLTLLGFERVYGYITVLIILSILYVVGFVYINIVWHLASVVSVLEDMYGIQAMIKSMNLIKGKVWVASAIFLKLQVSFLAIQVAFQDLVVYGQSGLLNRVCYAILLVLLLSLLIHLALVIQTVVYFVCKSYHHENIDKSCLADHLEVYLGEYVPLKGKDVQLEQLYA